MNRLKRHALRAIYQASVALGIAFLPVALMLRRAGLTLPIHRVVNRCGEAYARAR